MTVILDISICPTGLEPGDDGDLIDRDLLLTRIREVAVVKWPGATITWRCLQIGFRQCDEWAHCWIDGKQDDDAARSLLDDDIDWTDEDLYETPAGSGATGRETT